MTEGAPDQGSDWPAKSYPIKPGTGTGETCCTTFWIKFNQRFQSLSPSNETYAANIETAIYNAMLRAMIARPPAGTGNTATNTDSGGANSNSNSGSAWFPAMKGTVEQRQAAASSQLAADADPTLPPGIRYHGTMEGLCVAQVIDEDEICSRMPSELIPSSMLSRRGARLDCY